jgi:hypothetical protein
MICREAECQSRGRCDGYVDLIESRRRQYHSRKRRDRIAPVRRDLGDLFIFVQSEISTSNMAYGIGKRVEVLGVLISVLIYGITIYDSHKSAMQCSTVSTPTPVSIQTMMPNNPRYATYSTQNSSAHAH